MSCRIPAVMLAVLLAMSAPGAAVAHQAAPDVAAASGREHAAATESDSAGHERKRAYYVERASSPQPRERALATLLTGIEHAWPPRRLVLDAAAAAAPDDVLVQWLRVHWRETPGSSCRRAGPDLAAAAELFRLEPGNAAVHLLRLSRAWHDGDDLAIDQALVSMAAADRFDSHLLALSQAQVEVFSRHPLPRRGEDAEPAAGDPHFADAALALGQAAMALPDFSALAVACDVFAAQADAGLHRYAACADTARLMLRAPSLLERAFGFAVLRKSAQITAEESAAAARQRRLMQQIARIDEPAQAEFLLLTHALNDETAAAEETLRRHAGGAEAEPAGDF